MSYKQDQFTSDFASMNSAHVIDVDAQDEHAIMTDNEEDVQSYSHFGTTSSYPEAQFTPSQAAPFQQHQEQEQQEEYYDRDAEDQDADSEMHDGDDEELLDYDQDSDLDEEDEIEEDEDAESFDEEDEDEDEDEEDGSENGSDEGGGGAADPGANGKPGATEDDAIELSD